ncbi:MAG TPA: tripartite tricarboxylate transporter substrate binding protein [Burkholderiales bacterium]|nr:tripartite tricarboxylate transporter substrate binding protein [Burkholderiales bacterium]
MRIWLTTPILALLLAAGGVDAQQNYPTKPIRLIVPFPPGGPSDVVARMLAQKLTETFRKTVVVDNRAGGGGTIGTETAVRADPDGYTMIIVSAAYTANAALYRLSYDPVNDVAPIALIGEAGNLVVLQPSVPIKSIKELIAYDKANSGKLNYGSGGTGGDTHLAPELFNQMAGTRMTHVPYKGTGPALSELLGGQIHLMFGNMSVMVPHVKSNRLRAIAVTTARRSNVLPDIPTVADSLPGYEAVTWAAVLGPKTLPKGIVARWSSEIERIVQLPDVKERLVANGMETVGGSPERVRKVLERDVAKWQKVVALAGIKPGG